MIKGWIFVKIKWYELLILIMTALCVLIFLGSYFATVQDPGVWISTERGTAFQEEAPDAQGAAFSGEQEGAALVDLNTAGLEELEGLPGIGRVKAQAILDYRSAHGAFRSVEELLNVDGIGEKLLAKIRDYVTVSPDN